jgi:anti-sigma B factor antagonist
MRLEEQAEKDATVIALRGNLDALAAPAVADRLRDLLQEGQRRIVLDLIDVSYLSSAGLRVIQEGLQQAREQGGELRLAGLQGLAREALDRSGLGTLVTLYPDRAAALSDFHLSLRHRDVDGVTVVEPDGALDESAVAALEERLDLLMAEGRRQLVLDLSRVTQVSTPSLAALQRVLLALHARQGDLRLASPSLGVGQTLSETGYGEEFRLYNSIAAAVDSYR